MLRGLLSTLLAFSALISFGQAVDYNGGDVIEGHYLGYSEPLSFSSAPVEVDQVPKADGFYEKDDLRGRKNMGPQTYKAEPKRDGLVDLNSAFRHPTRFPFVLTNGMGDNGVNPPDPYLSVGSNHVVQVINGFGGTNYRIFDKQGLPITGMSNLNGFWGQFGKTGLGDPLALYDKSADRWVLTEFSSGGNAQLFAVSETGDPLGSYYAYEFLSPTFPDYPKYGIWHNAYYGTTNENFPTIYAFERDSMLVGGVARMVRFTLPALNGFGFQTLSPVDWDGVEPDTSELATLWRHVDDEAHNPGNNDPNFDRVEYWEFIPNFDSAQGSFLSGPNAIPVSEFDSDIGGLFAFAGIVQPNSSVSLDPLREVLMQRIQYRSFDSFDVAVATHVTDVDGSDWAGMRWYEFRKLDTTDWFLFQEGTFAPDKDNRWMGCASMDKHGNIGLAYLVSSDSTFPSARYTGRLSSDNPGTMTFLEQEIATGFGSNGSNRYGDYSSLTIDPVDDESFWFTGQYNPTNNWGTAIAAFKLDYECQGLYATRTVDVSGICGPNTSASITITPTGGFGNYEYSLDGLVYQQDSVFTNLSTGTYKVLVRDPDSTHCVVSLPGAQITNWQPLMVSSIATNPTSSTSQDGRIIVNGFSGRFPYEYSLDGISFSNNKVFSGLGPGIYNPVVRDANNCTTTDTVELSTVTGLASLDYKVFKVYPNPNKGTFSLSFPQVGKYEARSIRAIILDSQGKTISESTLIGGQSPLSIESSGIYLLRIEHKKRVLGTLKIIVE